MRTLLLPLSVLCLTLSTIASAQPPNIVLILVDDLGWKDVGFNGAEFYETPNMDRMAEAGMIFTDAYSGGPTCAPTRASLISGMYPPRHMIYTPAIRSRISARKMRLLAPLDSKYWHHIGITDPVPDPFPVRGKLPSSVVSIADVLKTAGYRTARIGKWQIARNNMRFDESNGVGDTKDPESTFKQAEAGVKFIKKNRDRPFFLFLSHNDVHEPLVARKNLVDKYKDKLKSLPKRKRDYNPTYAAMIDAVDSSVGRIIETLDKYDLSEKTLVILTSDNGGDEATNNAPLRSRKQSLYEGGIRVPTCMKWPGVIEAGTKSSVPITTVDFLPTFASLAGAELPTGQSVDGESFEPLLRGSTHSLAERAIFWHYPLYMLDITTPASAIRKGNWKLIEFFDGERLELYDLASDISESNNLASAKPGRAKNLHQELIEWRRVTNAPVPQQLNPHYRDNSHETEQITTNLRQVEAQILTLQNSIQILQTKRSQLLQLIGQFKVLSEDLSEAGIREDDIRTRASRILAQ